MIERFTVAELEEAAAAYLGGGEPLPPADATELKLVAPVVDEWVGSLPLVVNGKGRRNGRANLGSTMLVARLVRRRNSPMGIATFTGENAVYVQRQDPDVAQLLGLGVYARPVAR